MYQLLLKILWGGRLWLNLEYKNESVVHNITVFAVNAIQIRKRKRSMWRWWFVVDSNNISIYTSSVYTSFDWAFTYSYWLTQMYWHVRKHVSFIFFTYTHHLTCFKRTTFLFITLYLTARTGLQKELEELVILLRIYQRIQAKLLFFLPCFSISVITSVVTCWLEQSIQYAKTHIK